MLASHFNIENLGSIGLAFGDGPRDFTKVTFKGGHFYMTDDDIEDVILSMWDELGTEVPEHDPVEISPILEIFATDEGGTCIDHYDILDQYVTDTPILHMISWLGYHIRRQRMKEAA